MKTFSLLLCAAVFAVPAFAVNVKLPSITTPAAPLGGPRAVANLGANLPAAGSAVPGSVTQGAVRTGAEAVAEGAKAQPASVIPNTPAATPASSERPSALDVLKGAAAQPTLMSSMADGSQVRSEAAAERPANKKWRCLVCDFKYDESKGFGNPGDDNYIAPGTRWEDVPGDWVCPDCLEPKSSFDMVEDI